MIGFNLGRYRFLRLFGCILLTLSLFALSGCTSKGRTDDNVTIPIGGESKQSVVPMADLVVSEFYAPQSIKSIDDFYINIAIKNSGAKDISKPFDVGLYISLDPQMEQENLHQIGITAVEKLASGATKYIYDFTIVPSLDIPIIPGSTYYISIMPDTNNLVSESNETNNMSSIREFLYDMPLVMATSFVDGYEEDDTQDDATEIESGEIQKHNFYDDTTDWYKIYLSSTREYTIETMYLGLLADTNLTLINEIEDVNITDSNSGDDSVNASKIVIYPEISDNYYILASSAQGIVGLGSEYSIMISSVLVGAADEYEDDDSYENATKIYDESIQDHNFYDDDSDWLSFEAKKDTNYTIETETIGVDADTVLALYDTDGVTELTRDDNSSSSSVAGSLIEWVAPSSSIYYINIISADGSSGDKRHYKVKLTEKGK